MIFLHLEGCHISYHKKYPDSFNFFTDTPKTKFNSAKAHQTINEYDNAVRYNDFVVSEVIDLVKKANKNSYVMYFSDHGEEVFRNKIILDLTNLLDLILCFKFLLLFCHQVNTI